MKFLFVGDLAWERELGAARIHMELEEELTRLGHDVDHYYRDDAFPADGGSRLNGRLGSWRFPDRARRHVSRVGSRYDVIDALEGALPYSKAKLGFEGLLVARSVGLSHAYREFVRLAETRWPDQNRGSWPGRVLRWADGRWSWRGYERSWACADLINVPNRDERRFLTAAGVDDRAVVLPYGLSGERREAFRRLASPPPARLARREIAFIGAWWPRKGTFDLGEIVRRVRDHVVDARFLFLGTHVSADVVHADLGTAPCSWIRVIPRFRSDELPSLLAEVTAGSLPAYAEGFGFALVEQLAAGLPTVSYAAAGPREILTGLDELLVPVGDVAGFAERLTSILRFDEGSYSSLGDRCARRADTYSWAAIAERTLDVYTRRLREI